MGRTKSKKDKTELRFIQKYQRKISEWWNNILDTEPTYIVPITRKAPRMLELFNKYRNGNLGEDIYKMDWIISEKAIPFLSNDEIRGSTFAVIDDIIIYGSTLKTVVENIKKREPKDISCFTFTYDIEGEKVPELEKYEIQYRLPTTEEENAVFSNELASSFSLLAKPYDVDHPIFYLKLRDYYQSEKRLESKFKKISKFVFNATSLRQREYSICSFSCVFSDGDFLRHIFNNQIEIDFEMSKIRTYSNLNTGDITLLPIYLLSMSVETLKQLSFNSNLSFLNDILRKTNERLHENGYKDKDVEIGMTRVCTFLVEYLYGRYFLLKLKSEKLFDDSAPVEPIHLFNDFDIRILFGKSFSREILSVLSSEKEKIDSHLKEIIQRRKQLNNLREYHTDSNRLTNQRLHDELFLTDKYQDIRNILFKHRDSEDVVYNLWNIFRLMYEKDIQERKEKKDVLDRLNYGFSFADLCDILAREFNCQVDRNIVSTALDYLIDRGAVVPRFVKNNGGVGRVFRFGENLNIYDLALIFHKTLESFALNFSERYIDKFLFEKLLTFVGAIIGKDYEFEDFRLKFWCDREGARLCIENRYPPQYLEQFCKKHKIIEERIYTKDGGSYERRIMLNKDFDRVLPPTTHNLPHEDLTKFANLADIVHHMCFKCCSEYTYKDILLALTTCNNTKNFLEALEADQDLWFSDIEIAIQRLFEVVSYQQEIETPELKFGLEDVLGGDTEAVKRRKKIRDGKKEISKSLAKCNEVFDIINQKDDIFKNLTEIKSRFDETYVEDTENKLIRMMARTWKPYSNLIGPDPKIEENKTYKHLQMFKTMAQMLTSIFQELYNCNLGDIIFQIEEYNNRAKHYNESMVSPNFDVYSPDDMSLIRSNKREFFPQIMWKKFENLKVNYNVLISQKIKQEGWVSINDFKYIMICDLNESCGILNDSELTAIKKEIIDCLGAYLKKVLPDGEILNADMDDKKLFIFSKFDSLIKTSYLLADNILKEEERDNVYICMAVHLASPHELQLHKKSNLIDGHAVFATTARVLAYAKENLSKEKDSLLVSQDAIDYYLERERGSHDKSWFGDEIVVETKEKDLRLPPIIRCRPFLYEKFNSMELHDN